MPINEIAEHLVKNVGKARREAGSTGRARSAFLKGSVAVAIIGGAALFVLEDVVGLVDYLELAVVALAVGVAIGMMLHGQFAVRFLDLVRAGVPGNPEGVIVVFLGH